MTENSDEAKYLRDNYIVKIIPMLNPGNNFKENFSLLLLL